MTYLIDTDCFIDYLFKDPAAQAHVDPLIPEGIAISSVTYMEAYQGVLRAPDRQGAEASLAAVLGIVPVLAFSFPEAHRCAQLREDLKQAGKRVRGTAPLNRENGGVGDEQRGSMAHAFRRDRQIAPGRQRRWTRKDNAAQMRRVSPGGRWGRATFGCTVGRSTATAA